jgi:hypothetical protein
LQTGSDENVNRALRRLGPCVGRRSEVIGWNMCDYCPLTQMAFLMRGLTGRDFVSKAFPPLESHFRGECSLYREISVDLDVFPL